jgi:uncharacterized protein (DUF2336 family)
MSEIETEANFAAPVPHDSTIVRRFLVWAQRADAGGRAEAANALARAYLYSDLPPALRREAGVGLTSLLDDHSTLVRRALAEALASASEAPHHIVLALACDISEVSCPVLARSPVLTDAELVDCAAIGDVYAQSALASRPRLSAGVGAAIAEIGERDAVLALAGNLDSDLRPGVLRRIVERFADDAAIREALLSRVRLPPTLRCDLVAATSRALSAFVISCDWLRPERVERIVREAREQGAIVVAASTRGPELADLVRSLRENGTLTIALLTRGLLCGDRALFTQALVELSGLPHPRVASFMRDPRSNGFAALYARTGLPSSYLSPFRAALLAIDECNVARSDQLLLSLVSRLIEHCEKLDSPDLAKFLSLLHRFEAEAARLAARDFADNAVAEAQAPQLVRIASGADAPQLTLEGPAEEVGQAPPVELPEDLVAALDAALAEAA